MSAESNKSIGIRVTAALNARDWETLSELMAPDILEGLRSDSFLDAFPDIQIIDEDILVDGDKVVKRWVDVGTHTGPYAGHAATGRRVSVPGISIDRIENGKVVETWLAWDELNLLRQLGMEKVPA